MTLDTATINSKLDTLYASTGTIGYALLLRAALVNTTVTLNAGTDIFTTTDPDPKYQTGSRVRLTGTFPAVTSGDPISASTDYFCIRLSATTFQLARSRADALAGSPIPILFNDAGSGLSFNEQSLIVDDPLAVLINKEVNTAGYYRYAINNIGAAVGGQKIISWSIPVASGDPAIVYRHKLVILGGTATIGNTTGTKDHLLTEVTDTTISPGQTAALGITFRLSNP